MIALTQVTQILEPWLGPLDDGVPAEFLEQLAAVDGMARLLTGEDAAQAVGLLSDAGCEDCGYPWSGEAAARLSRLMELAGLKGREVLKDYEVESVICYEGK